MRTILGWMLGVPLCFAAQPQIGGRGCSNATVSGTYFYLMNGFTVSNGSAAPYAELGKWVADGGGNFTGDSTSSANGTIRTNSLSGTYSVQSNCTGSYSITVNSQSVTQATFQVVGGGMGIVAGITNPGEVLTGRAYRQSASAAPAACGAASLSGAYGYTVAGFGPSSATSQTGAVTFDGRGGYGLTETAVIGGAVLQASAQGTYKVNSDCSGTTTLMLQSGPTEKFLFAVVEDGSGILFLETDTGTTVYGSGQPQFSAPQTAVVNGASFIGGGVAPGSLISIFGSGLATGEQQADSLPLAGTLGATEVSVNGKSCPLLYAGPNQINAQLPLGIAPGMAVLTVSAGGEQSNSVAVTVEAAAPGLFTDASGRAVVQNPDGSMNSETNPAHPGDVEVAYLTGGGAVKASGTLLAGYAAPQGASPVTLSGEATIDGQAVATPYIGLTPGFVGLYQANFRLPVLAAGDHQVAVMVGGVASNGARLTVSP